MISSMASRGDLPWWRMAFTWAVMGSSIWCSLASASRAPAVPTPSAIMRVAKSGGVPTTLAVSIFGALAVDASANTALAVNSGSNNISVITLGTNIKPVHIEQVLTSSAIPGAILPQAVLTTNSTPLAGGPVTLRILGTGFQSGTPAQARLDGTALTATVVSNTEIDATVPASFLTVPRHYALDVVVGGVGSNATDFTVVQSVDLTPACAAGSTPQPSAVAIGAGIPMTSGDWNRLSLSQPAGRSRAATAGAWAVSSFTQAELAGDQTSGRIDPVQPFASASSASPESTFSTLTITQRPPTCGLPAS